MNFQDASNLRIPEGYVRTIHDKNNRLLWGSVGYDVTFDGNATQTTYSGKNLFDGNNPLVITGFKDIALGKTYEAGTYTFSCTNITTTGSQSYCLMGVVYGGGSSATQGMTIAGKKLTITATEEFDKVRVYSSTNYQQSQGVTTTFTNFMLEVGSTATSYEPYVGGTPAPNPDYPQEIQTVTGENVVKVVGKNLSKTDDTDNPDANYVSSGAGSQPVQFDSTHNGFTTQSSRGRKYANLQAGQSYTFSLFAQINPDWAQNVVVYFYRYNPKTDTTGTVLASITKDTVPSGGGRVSRTITIPEGWDGLYVVFYGATYWNDVQLETGSTATTYEPYQGQSHTIDLGSIELAKIGNYQDRIYKDGEKWYVGKRVGKAVLDGTAGTFGSNQFGSNYRFYLVKGSIPAVATPYYDGATTPVPLSDIMIGAYQGTIANPTGATGCLFFPHSGVDFYFTVPDTIATSGATFKAWLTTHPMTIYYALATPTDTEITDQTLIDQLEAVYDWARRHGYNAQVSGDLPIVISRTALPTV